MNDLISKPWQKFFIKLKDIDDPIFKEKVFLWKPEHMLGYICKRFKSLYGKDFAITQKNAPTKCPEMFFVKKMISTLGTSNMIIVKEYVDWVYDTKIIPQNKQIRTLTYFMTPGFCNEFHFERTENEIIKRSTPLPSKFQEVANTLNISASTYGDLAFIKMAADRAKGDSNNSSVIFLENIKSQGFQLEVLDRLSE